MRIDRRRFLETGLTFGAVSALGLGYPLRAAAQEPVRLGVLTPLTGGGAVYGTAMSRAYVLVADEINKAGGILGKQGELVGQISGVVFAGVAVLRYEQLNDWVVRLFGIGADGWVLAVLVAIPAVGLAALYWFRNAGIYGRRSASSA